MAQGMSPLRVRPGSLVGYWPLGDPYAVSSVDQDYNPVATFNDLTRVNTPSNGSQDPPLGSLFGLGELGWMGAFKLALASRVFEFRVTEEA